MSPFYHKGTRIRKFCTSITVKSLNKRPKFKKCNILVPTTLRNICCRRKTDVQMPKRQYEVLKSLTEYRNIRNLQNGPSKEKQDPLGQNSVIERCARCSLPVVQFKRRSSSPFEAIGSECQRACRLSARFILRRIHHQCHRHRRCRMRAFISWRTQDKHIYIYVAVRNEIFE